MATVLEQLEAMRGVQEDWDGYGAAAPLNEVITAAIEFWREVQSIDRLPEPYVTPDRIGGVLFEWEVGPHQLEVEFLSPEEGEFVHLNTETKAAVSGKLQFRPHVSGRTDYSEALAQFWRILPPTMR